MKKLRKGTKVKFRAIDDFTGQRVEKVGRVIGHAKEIKAIEPVEFGELGDDEECYLVKVEGRYSTLRHVVFADEIIKDKK